MAEHNSFLIYKDNAPLVETCTDEQAGKLFKALFAFACDGEELDTDDRMLKGFYTVFRNAIIRDDAKYQERCRVNAENGKKGGRPKNQTEPNAGEENPTIANGCEVNRMQPKKPDRESDSVLDRESGSDCGTDTGRDIVTDSESGWGSGSAPDCGSDFGRGAGETTLPEPDQRQQELMQVFNQRRKQWQKGV